MKRLIFTLLILNSTQLFAQITYKNLVMEGGGVKGVAYGGALIELENRGILKDIVRVGGTSAGAIQACLLSVGYTAEEISKITNETPIESFNDGGFITKKTQSLFKEYGWYQGETFLETLRRLIGERTGNPDLTFADLHKLAASYPYRDLYVTGTNLTKQKLEVFSYETYPNMRVCDAVRVSMSIPLYFKALWINPEGKVFEKPTPEDACSLFVDGGMLMNYPIAIFDNKKYLEDPNKDEYVFNNETIGLRLERCEQIDQEIQLKNGPAPFDIKDFESYMMALMNVTGMYICPPKPEDTKRTIFINDAEMNPRIRKIPEEEKQKMILLGQQGAIEFFLRNK